MKLLLPLFSAHLKSQLTLTTARITHRDVEDRVQVKVYHLVCNVCQLALAMDIIAWMYYVCTVLKRLERAS
jgi:hypothetical protein